MLALIMMADHIWKNDTLPNGEVWFRSDCRHDIIYKVAVEDRCFGSLKTDALAARGFEGIM